MDRVRYFLGVVMVLMLPCGVLFWFIIHPWARWWRRLGALRAYLIVLAVTVAFGALLFRLRLHLLGRDLGTNWMLLAIALLFFGAVVPLELRYWKQLSVATLIGVPELSANSQGKLLRDGIYRTVRHPRYLSAGLGVIANALFINYAGVYLLILLVIPVGYAMLLLEERELTERFGDAYREYQKEVPRLIPRL